MGKFKPAGASETLPAFILYGSGVHFQEHVCEWFKLVSPVTSCVRSEVAKP